MITIIYDPINGMAVSDARAIPLINEWLGHKQLEVTLANAFIILMIGEAVENKKVEKNEVEFKYIKDGVLSKGFGIDDQEDQFVALMESMLSLT